MTRRSRPLGVALLVGLLAGLGWLTTAGDPAGVARLEAASQRVLAGLGFPGPTFPVFPDGRGALLPLEDPSGHALDALHRALERAERGRGQARLAFFGGSHTASDHYTGWVRDALQARFGDAGHGFVPMAPIVSHQWAWGMRIDAAEGFEARQVGRKRPQVDRYGLAGAVYVGFEPGAFAAVQSDTWGRGRWADTVELLYDRRPGGGRFEVRLDGRVWETLSAQSDVPRTGRFSARLSDGPHRLEVRVLGGGDVPLFGALFERARPGVVVDNLGLIGAKARHLLLWDEASFRALLVARKPDLVAFAYGNNESTDAHLGIEDHRRDLEAALRRVRRALPHASCVLMGPTDRPRRTRRGLAARPVVEAISGMTRAVALAHGCAFFDTLGMMGGLGGGARWRGYDPPWLGDDLQHLTREGYHFWGYALHRALLAGYRKSE